jgi:4a-hydroxytetrahydrobiopterin dehydratase
MLSEQSCEACRVGAPLVSEEEKTALLSSIPQWTLVNTEDPEKLRRVFSFDNFVLAMEFANRVGELAEAQGHHPALLVEWGRVTVSWWTHTIKGLHKNDFIMAAKTDALYG